MRHSHAAWRLAIVHEVADGVTIVTASGRLSAAMAGRWGDTLGRLAGEGKIVLDLTHVDYASSAAIVALSAFLDRRDTEKGGVVVCGIGDAVRLTLDLAGLYGRLTVAPSRASATALFIQSSRSG